MGYTLPMTMIRITLLTLICCANAAYAASPSIGTRGDDPLSKLDREDREYYNLSFSYAMDSTLTDDFYEWRTATAEGKIRPGQRFANNEGHTCRPFAETFKVGKMLGQASGFGCKRQGENGWCKLHDGNMLTCALDKQEGMLDKIGREATSAGQRGSLFKDEAESSFWDWWPF